MSLNVARFRRCTEWSGVSRTARTSGRRSFSTTSAARQIRLCAKPVASALTVFMLHGTMIMPSVTNDPLETAAL